jgi:MFS superfamily sulfate permease-like transporter
VALGASNLVAGLSSGFVQSGGASQTAAAEGAGGRTPLTAVVCAVLVLLTGAFLGAVFTDLPQATLAAVVIVAVSGFWDVAELRRIAHVRRSAGVFAALGMIGVLTLGVLQGLVVTAVLTLVYVFRLLAGARIAPVTRDATPDDTLVLRADGPLFYANVQGVKDRVLDLVEARGPSLRRIVLDLSPNTQLDVQAADVLGELADLAAARGAGLVLADVRAPVREVLTRAGVTPRVAIVASLDAAMAAAPRASAR